MSDKKNNIDETIEKKDEQITEDTSRSCCHKHEESNCRCKHNHDKSGLDLIKELKEEIEKQKQENTELKSHLLLCRADTENLRKRFEKEKEESIKYAGTKFSKDLLVVLDNFDRAIKNTNESTNIQTLIDGIKITEKELLSVLQKHGINKIEVNKGDPFDHNLHQIMCEVEDDSVASGSIAVIYQDGYTIHGRLLRPTLVGISKTK